MKRLLAPMVLVVVSLAVATPAVAQTGTAVVQRMHDAYAGKWYRTLTFVQTTIVTRATGQTDTTIWYESLSGPTRLRIDQGHPSLGNGSLNTADSTIVMRGGNVARRAAGGNVFLPLIMGVYLQPVDVTMRQLQSFRFDLSKTHTSAQWRGQPVIVVGAAAATDSLSPQFWVNADNVVVRVRGSLFGPGSADIDLDGYERVGQGWLATRVIIKTGNLRQQELYSDWKANPPLAESLFDPMQWKTAPHWVK